LININGRVWIFGDNVSTEYMMPGYTMLAKMSDERAKLHCMEAIRPGFARQVHPGDILIGGENFGCGSSRLASRLLIALGFTAVIAESFAGIFFRNGINTGLPLIECPGIRQSFHEGDLCRVNLAAGAISNVSNGKSASFNPFPEHLLRILRAGGLVGLLKGEFASAG
jgi:3-isopropylmalate/(R)-2-methylmalate dehydratase small subunit